MNDNQKKVLEMLSEQKISVDEAYRLLSLVEDENEEIVTPAVVPASEENRKRSYKYFRVVVQPKEGPNGKGGEKVNVRVPMALIRAGMKLTSLIPSSALKKANDALEEKGMDVDLSKMKPEDFEQIVETLAELELDVETEKEKINIFVE